MARSRQDAKPLTRVVVTLGTTLLLGVPLVQLAQTYLYVARQSYDGYELATDGIGLSLGALKFHGPRLMFQAWWLACAAAVGGLLWRSRGGRGWVRWWLVASALALAPGGWVSGYGVRLAHRGHAVVGARVDAAADQVIAALERYERDHAHPPARLELLVPDYLPWLPTTGVKRYPRFLYRPACAVLGYAMPSRTMVVYTARSAGATSVSVHPPDLPPNMQPRPFDAALWRRSPEARSAMAVWLAQDRAFAALTRDQVVAKLGAPDGEHALCAGRWRLAVRAPAYDGCIVSYQPGVRPDRPWRGRWQHEFADLVIDLDEYGK